MKNFYSIWNNKRIGNWLVVTNTFLLLVFINILTTAWFTRLDMTEEKRFTIKPQTKELLQQLDTDIYVEVFLSENINPTFQRFRNSIKEILQEFTIYSNHRVTYSFTDPMQAGSGNAQKEFMESLIAKGVPSLNVVDHSDITRSEKIVFPGAIVSVGIAERGVSLLKGSRTHGTQEAINQSIENIEYELAQVIYNLTNSKPKTIGITIGHGELDSIHCKGFYDLLNEQFLWKKVRLDASTDLQELHALVIVKPTKTFSTQEKYKLDQYVMNGGNILFLLDKLEVDMRQAEQDDYFASTYDIQLDDLLFKYGVRVNASLLQDKICNRYPIVTGQLGNQPQFMLMDWPYFPVLLNYTDHVITRNLDATASRFISSLDTVKAIGIKKTPLVFTSMASKEYISPVKINLQEIRNQIKNLNSGPYITACLLEGSFTSLFINRFLPKDIDTTNFRTKGKSAKIIVVADGDIARNEVNPRTAMPQPLGFDSFSNYTYSNADLLRNMVAYLTDEGGLISARNKKIKIRLLDKDRAGRSHYWQLINIGLPLVFLAVFGFLKSYVRKNKYT